MNALIEESRDFLHSALGKDILLDLKLSVASLPVMVDEEQFRQVLLNIASNARDAMRGKGAFSLRTDRCYGQPQVCGFGMSGEMTFPAECLACTASSDNILVEFSDNGRGMAPEVLLRIFDPYFTTKKLGQGTGLGLSVVKGVIEQIGGQIYCASKIGMGTQFQIRLPLAAADRSSRSTNQTFDESDISGVDGRNALSIFAIDDEEDILNFVSNMLRGEGLRVYIVNSPMEALVRLRAIPEKKIGIILCDMTMPGMSGRILSKQLLHIKRDARIILMTGFSGDASDAAAGGGGGI